MDASTTVIKLTLEVFISRINEKTTPLFWGGIFSIDWRHKGTRKQVLLYSWKTHNYRSYASTVQSQTKHRSQAARILHTWLDYSLHRHWKVHAYSFCNSLWVKSWTLIRDLLSVEQIFPFQCALNWRRLESQRLRNVHWRDSCQIILLHWNNLRSECN